jgi:hypothetical protein
MAKETPLEKKQRVLLNKFYGKKKKKVAVRKTKKQKIAMLKAMPYRRFLKTKYWASVRVLVLSRDKYKCVICQSNIRLEVHHDSYKHHGDEKNHLGDLLTLCHKCHQEHHKAMD